MIKNRFIAGVVAMAAIPMSAHAGLPWLADIAGDRDLPRPFGIGFDFYTMDQDYDIESLSFTLPGAGLGNPAGIAVTNEIQHFDLKVDAWLFPFLNVFGLVGYVDGETTVDLSQAGITGLPFPLGSVDVNYDGSVYGVGFTAVVGGEHWFAAATTTWTDASLDGDFDSSVESLAIQPRIGWINDKWTYWIGGMYLDSEESHQGAIDLGIPGAPVIPFAVELASAEEWNYTLGARYVFSEHMDVSLELGFGDREHTLFNWNYRF